MNATLAPTRSADVARRRILSRRGEPLFLADWERAVFLHFETDPDLLQAQVPFPLDLWRGRAFVSLVAFTMRDLRPSRGGGFGRWLFRPFGTHPYLNVRTYVKAGDEPGIHFLAEWMTNPFTVHLGRPLFGLPYRLGEARYDHAGPTLAGEVQDRREGSFRYEARVAGTESPELGGLTEFLVERYTCFTHWRGWRRYFRVWHEPWPIESVQAEIEDAGLLRRTGPWADEARLIGANFSPGVSHVWMGRPHTLTSSKL